MKKILLAAISTLLLLSACAAPVTAQSFLESQEVDPASISLSARLIHEDGSTETLPLDPAAQQAILAAFPSAVQVTEDASTAEQAGSHHLFFEDWTLYVDASGTQLTLIHPVEQDGETVLVQSHFVMENALASELFPAAQSAQALQTLTTLDDRLATADISLVEAQGEVLEFTPFADSIPGNPQGNAFAVLREGALILGAQKMSLEGQYLPMLVQEAERVGSTLIVRVAVSSDDKAGAVSLASPGDITEVWFVESGTIMEIVDVQLP